MSTQDLKLFDLLDGLEMTKSQYEWLARRFENMTAKEALLFRGAMQIEQPQATCDVMQIANQLEHYELLYGAGNDFALGTPDAVKHEHEQNIEFPLLGALLDDLQLVPVFSSNLMPGHAVLLFLVNNRPAHFFTEAMALSALHGNVGLAFVVVVHLLVGGHAV